MHGEADDLIAVEACASGARGSWRPPALAVEWHVRPGLAHGIDAAGERLGGGFIAQACKA